MKDLTFSRISNLTENQVREYLERIRWSDGVYCPHCGIEGAYKLTPKEGSKRPVRPGTWKCKNKHCRKQFTVRVGMVFEGSNIPLKKWLMAISLMCSSKKGISSHQLHRMLGVTYKTAWFMSHRIRLAMDKDLSRDKLKGIVEVDDGFIGGRVERKLKADKTRVVFIVERNGRAKSVVTDRVTSANVTKILVDNVDIGSTVYTDGAFAYVKAGRKFKEHQSTTYYKYKGRPIHSLHLNNVDNFIGIFKRGLTGVYQHVSKQHLHRYLSEFDFRHSFRDVKDEERTTEAVRGLEGKRMYCRFG